MMNTVRDVYNIAIRLMDSQNESNGETEIADNKEYMSRTPSLLNSILDRCLSASDTYPSLAEMTKPGRRPVVPKVASLDDQIDLDERIITGVLPYGLAALLMAAEDQLPGVANFFWQTFLEQLEDAKHNLAPAHFESIEDAYGMGIEHGEFSHW